VIDILPFIEPVLAKDLLGLRNDFCVLKDEGHLFHIIRVELENTSDLNDLVKFEPSRWGIFEVRHRDGLRTRSPTKKAFRHRIFRENQGFGRAGIQGDEKPLKLDRFALKGEELRAKLWIVEIQSVRFVEPFLKPCFRKYFPKSGRGLGKPKGS
jgi:hypothetical protein